jgi:hypothetical protein
VDEAMWKFILAAVLIFWFGTHLSDGELTLMAFIFVPIFVLIGVTLITNEYPWTAVIFRSIFYTSLFCFLSWITGIILFEMVLDFRKGNIVGAALGLLIGAGLSMFWGVAAEEYFGWIKKKWEDKWPKKS